MSASGSADVAVMACVRVANAAWVEELRRAVKLTRRDRNGQAILTLVDGKLRTRLGGIEFEVSCDGRWPGEAKVSVEWLRTLARVPPVADPLEISVSLGRMRIASSTVPCEWQRAGNASIVVPIGAQLLEILQLPLRHSPAALEASGLSGAVKKAERELAFRLNRALTELAPLGVSKNELAELVCGHIEADGAV